MNDLTKLQGLVPLGLAPRIRKIVLEDYRVPVDIGFHDFEVGAPQGVSVTVEVWLEEAAFPESDRVADAWDYDYLRTEIGRIAGARRFNLQETLARQIYDSVAARRGVSALRVSIRKTDVYPDCAGVGVELASF